SGSVIPGKKMVVEYKTTSPGYADFIDYLEAAGLKPQLMFQSFSQLACEYAISRGFNVERLWSGTPTESDINDLAAAGVRRIGLNKVNLTSTIIGWAHTAGMEVMVFTINTSGERDTWLADGVDCIITDYPGVLNPAAVTGPVFKQRI